MFSKRLTRFMAAGAAALVVAAGAYGIVDATAGNSSGTATTATSFAATTSGQYTPGSTGSNARSGPAAGGTVGTVGSASASSFTLTTSADQKVIVDKASDTTYKKGTSSTSASAVTKGASVLVLGTTNGTTIAATQVIVEPVDSGSGSSSVVPFQRGAPSTSKQVGQIPADYSEGSGTIVGGTAANKATKAALGAYPGGIVDRVVKIGNGEYEVHNIGVNWPHHIFVNKSFKVVGAN
jgi:hypothetical protein